MCTLARSATKSCLVFIILPALLVSSSCTSLSGTKSSFAESRTSSNALTITGLTPAAATAGIHNLAVAVQGTNFTVNTVVRWNGVPVPTSKSGKTLQVTITAAQLAAPGAAQVVAFDNRTGMKSNAVTFAIAAATTSSATPPASPLAITTTSIPNGRVGVAYQTNLAASGGTPPYSWTVNGLPPGLSPSSSGVISGLPVSTSSSTVTLQVTDAKTASARVQVGLSIAGYSSLTIAPANLSLTVASSRQLAATLNWTDGSTSDVTGSATWHSSDASKATVVGGLVTGVAAGAPLISATYNSQSGQSSVTVTATSAPPPGPGACPAPNYCADTSTGIKPYGGSLSLPPLLNQSFTDPTFNRKIWRITDTNTSANVPNDSIGIYFHPFQYAGQWNRNNTALILQGGHGDMAFLKLNLADPNAPSATPWLCSYGASHLDCSNSKVNAGGQFSRATWANTQNYLAYAIDENTGDNALWSCDLTATYSNGATAPTCSRQYSPFDSGQCFSGTTAPGGAVDYVALSPDDQYFWGWGAPTPSAGKKYGFVLHKAGQGCLLLNMGTTPWQIEGTAWTGTSTGALSFVDEDGTSVGNAGTNCSVHGSSYDSVTNTIILDMNAGDPDCAVLPSDSSPGVTVNLTTMKVTHMHKSPFNGNGNGLGGHGFGIANVGGSVGDLFLNNPINPHSGIAWGTVTAPRDCATNFNCLQLTDWGPSLGSYLSHEDFHGSNTDYINGNSSLPLVGVAGWINIGGSVPPTDTYSVLGPYDGEIDATVLNSVSDSNSSTTYRFVHHYSATGNYTTYNYGWAVFPTISRDRCWVAFASNWMGHLGSQSGGNCSTTPSACRYDVFLTYLCGSDGT